MTDLGLNEDESIILKRMIGSRYNSGSDEVKLISRRYGNRIENKKYLTYLLEDLLLKTRELNKIKDQYLIK